MGSAVAAIACLAGVAVARVAARRRRDIRRAIAIMLDPPPEDPDELLAFQVAHGVYRCPPDCVDHPA